MAGQQPAPTLVEEAGRTRRATFGVRGAKAKLAQRSDGDDPVVAVYGAISETHWYSGNLRKQLEMDVEWVRSCDRR